MKNLKIAIALIALSLSASQLKAQSTVFKPFKVDLSAGYAMPLESGSKGGVLIAVEPKYSISDEITLGLRLEASLTAYAVQSNGNSVTGDIKATGSYLLTGDYFFGTNTFRPFAGVGVGLYTVAGASFSDNEVTTTYSDNIGAANKFGFAPRVGFEVSHFRMAAEYNFAGKNNNMKYDYLGIKIGFFLGGGQY